MKNFNKRLSFLMDHVLHTSGSKMGRALNVNVSSILRYKNGQASPSVEFVEKLCDHYGISANWLLMEIGPKKIADLILNAEDQALPVVNTQKTKAMTEDLDHIKSMIDDVKQKYCIL